MKFVVMRRAVLQEDEGRDHYIQGFETEQEALAFVANQVGYFKPGDFYILKRTPL